MLLASRSGSLSEEAWAARFLKGQCSAQMRHNWGSPPGAAQLLASAPAEPLARDALEVAAATAVARQAAAVRPAATEVAGADRLAVALRIERASLRQHAAGNGCAGERTETDGSYDYETVHGDAPASLAPLQCP